MSEADFETYKAHVLQTAISGEPDRNGFKWIEAEVGEDVDRLARAMKELKEEGRFKEYTAYISPPKWAVRL